MRRTKDKKETKIEQIVRESGNSFHCEVSTLLRVKGWDTLVSPYYMDGGTNKPREIDLVAERHWTYGAQALGSRDRRHGAIIIKLFIECKYIKQPTVFWFSDKDVASATNWLEGNTPLRGNNAYIKQHHYIGSNPRVAKLFASTPGAAENDPIYKALNQSLNAMVYLRGRESIIRELDRRKVPVLRTLEMPIILCHSFTDFYRVEMEAPDKPKAIDANFQLEVNYAYLNEAKQHKTEYFLIDVVDFAKLESFLEVLAIDKDAVFSVL